MAVFYTKGFIRAHSVTSEKPNSNKHFLKKRNVLACMTGKSSMLGVSRIRQVWIQVFKWYHHCLLSLFLSLFACLSWPYSQAGPLLVEARCSPLCLLTHGVLSVISLQKEWGVFPVKLPEKTMIGLVWVMARPQANHGGWKVGTLIAHGWASATQTTWLKQVDYRMAKRNLPLKKWQWAFHSSIPL